LSKLNDFFKEYSEVLGGAQGAFEAIEEQFPREVTCTEGCDDCCRVLFDLHLIEALALRQALIHALDEDAQERVLKKAGEALAAVMAIRDHLGLTSMVGPPDERLLEEMSKQRYDCPLLESGLCLLYDFRPVTCRVYGVVTEVQGRGTACPRSGFEKGETYPTVKLDAMNKTLADISKRLFSEITGSGAPPPVMSVAEALLCKFDEEFFERALNAGE
jgi:Fe-S-cluster containining protein